MTFSLKRIPKWAWIASGGVIAGGLALRVVKARGEKAAASTTTADGSTVPDSTALADQYGGLPQQFAGGNTSVLVPPVVVGDGNAQPGVDVPSTLDAIGGFIQPQESLSDIIAALTPLLTGGGAPVSAAPPGVVVAPSVSSPVSTAPPAAPAHRSCPSKYPLWNPARGDCYQVIPCYNTTRDGKPVHFRGHAYQGGQHEYFNEAPGHC